MRVLLTVLLVTALAPGAHAQSPGADGLRHLAWLAGCWEERTPTRVTMEMWSAPAGGLMVGASRTVVRDVAREFEFLRIEPQEGRLAYVAQPGGRPPTAFPVTALSDSTATFENGAHDFPQRIHYRRAGPDSLVARIEGPQGGTVRRFDFRMRRVACTP